ncbi:MAG: glucosamine 6-phosphate synthetase-like amidotransferase/phosphosugar isomerase protein, partial [Cellvibrionaceae bacterium]
MTTENKNAMVQQVESLPGMIRSEFKELDKRVRLVMNHDECLSIKRIVITGCGDSHMAGVATELAFEKLAQIPTEPMRANTGGRYASPYTLSHFPNNPLVIGVSFSGTTARTLEALQLFKNSGLPTMALAGNPDSPMGELADKVLACTAPDFVPAPGIRSYRMSLMALYLLAIRLGEIKGLHSQDEAGKLRQSLLSTADAIEATIAAVNDKTRKMAEAFA